MKYYMEILEDLSELESFQPPELFRKYVLDVKDAEKEFAKAVLNFGSKKIKAKFVEMNHDADYSKTKPCVSKEIKDGKVIL